MAYHGDMPRKQDILEMLRDEPDDHFLLYALAHELVNEEDFAGAVDAFTRCLASKPDYSAGWYHKGAAQIKAGDLEGARQTLEHGIEVAKRNGDWHAGSEMETLLAEVTI